MLQVFWLSNFWGPPEPVGLHDGDKAGGLWHWLRGQWVICRICWQGYRGHRAEWGRTKKKCNEKKLVRLDSGGVGKIFYKVLFWETWIDMHLWQCKIWHLLYTFSTYSCLTLKAKQTKQKRVHVTSLQVTTTHHIFPRQLFSRCPSVQLPR